MANTGRGVSNTQLLEHLEKTNELIRNQDKEIAKLCDKVDRALNERRKMETQLAGHEERIKANKENLDTACDDIEDLKKKSYIWNGLNTLSVGITAAIAAIFGR